MLNLEQRKAFQEVRERTRLSVDISELAMLNRFGFESRCSNIVEQLSQLFGKSEPNNCLNCLENQSRTIASIVWKTRVEQLSQLFRTPISCLKSKTAERLLLANSWPRTRKGSRRSMNNWDNGSTIVRRSWYIHWQPALNLGCEQEQNFRGLWRNDERLRVHFTKQGNQLSWLNRPYV